MANPVADLAVGGAFFDDLDEFFMIHTSGFEPHPKTPEGYIGEPPPEQSFRNCLNCHTTRFTSESDRKGPEVADHGIGMTPETIDRLFRPFEQGSPEITRQFGGLGLGLRSRRRAAVAA